MENPQSRFTGWAIIDLYGHTKVAGHVETLYFGTAAMFQLTVPAIEVKEYELQYAEHGPHTGYEHLEPGTKVKIEATEEVKQLLGVGSIYRMTACTEEHALEVLEELMQRPMIVVSPMQVEQAPWKCGTCVVAVMVEQVNGKLLESTDEAFLIQCLINQQRVIESFNGTAKPSA